MTPPEMTLSGRQPRAVQSALHVLEEVARAGAGVTAKEITTRLGMPTATTYRLLNLLVGEGYLVRLPDLSGFALGHKVGVLVDATVAPVVCEAARDILAELRLTVRFGVHLYLFTNTAVRAADVDHEYAPPADEQTINRNLHASAVGKLLIAEKDDPTALLGSDRLPRLTARTITSVPDLQAHLALTVGRGYAVEIGELIEDAACVAVPVRSSRDVLVGAIEISGRAEHEQIMQRQVAAIAPVVAQLSRLLA